MGQKTPVAQVQGLGQSGHQGHGFGAAPAAGFLPPPANEGLELEIGSHYQGADPPWPLEFVASQAQQIDRKLVEFQRLMAHHLHGIHVQKHASLPAAPANGLDGLEGAHLTLAPDQRHQSRWWFEQ
jgi:hypothetical protein